VDVREGEFVDAYATVQCYATAGGLLRRLRPSSIGDGETALMAVEFKQGVAASDFDLPYPLVEVSDE
jgi:hypothetical protein